MYSTITILAATLHSGILRDTILGAPKGGLVAVLAWLYLGDQYDGAVAAECLALRKLLGEAAGEVSVRSQMAVRISMSSE